MIDLNDYAHTAAQHGWGAGWPSCSGARLAGLAVVTAPRSGVGVSVHRRIARLVGLLFAESERRGYLLHPGQCWGYACRAIAGTAVASNHSWGLAVDINSLANPYQFPRRTDMPTWMPLLWNRYGFAWGGNYNDDGRIGKADSMHYEFMGTPADADPMTALALYELTGEFVPVGGSATSRKDDPVAVITISVAADNTFRSAVMAEAGGDSIVVARAWITLASTWGTRRSRSPRSTAAAARCCSSASTCPQQHAGGRAAQRVQARDGRGQDRREGDPRGGADQPQPLTRHSPAIAAIALLARLSFHPFATSRI